MIVNDMFMAFVTLFSKYLIGDMMPSNPEGRIRNSRTIESGYDFIVIGAGSAGAVVANRLSEIPYWKVLLIEAGGEEPFLGQVPLMAATLQLSDVDWKMRTVTQPGRACLAFNDQRCLWPQGKMLGGSSSLNYMLYVRGNRRDYDRWAELGNDGWSYEEVLPYFVKSEDNTDPVYAATRYHGTGGYLTVSSNPYKTPLGEAFIQGGREMGYEIRDGNGEYQTGFMYAQGTMRKGHRCSSSKAFLRPIRNRPNLHISLNSRVLKVLIDEETKTAIGVRYEKEGRIYQILADKEVILSAGATMSPQLLMLSGVGPAAHLAQVGISPVLADLPVGLNMQDHVGLGGMVFLVDQPVSIIEDRIRANLSGILDYILHAGTPMSSLGGVEGLAWVKTKYADPKDDWPDVQYHFASGSDVSDGGERVRVSHGVSDAVWDEYYAPISKRDSWSVLPTNLRPTSRGSIRLQSSDPYDDPIIDPNYYADPQDAKVIIEGVKIALRLSQTPAFQKYGSRFYDKPYPGCTNITMWTSWRKTMLTDAYLDCLVRQYTIPLYHIIGTCQMGPDWEPNAVVNPRLQVRGIRNLRVIDSSIMPTIPSGNTNAMAIMIGEKGADMIKETWYYQDQGAVNRRRWQNRVGNYFRNRFARRKALRKRKGKFFH